jgi:hypothetical protein
MAAPIMDKVIPPIVFLVALLTVFVMIVTAMTPTIESNQNSSFNPPKGWTSPDYFIMFANGTYSYNGIWTPDPMAVNYSMTSIGGDGDAIAHFKFHNGARDDEKSHDISMWPVRRELFDLSGDRHQLRFYQSGGWLGLQEYRDRISPNDWDRTYANSSDPSWFASINLRHVYNLVLRPGTGSNNTFTSFLTWNFNLTLLQLNNATQSINPWTIVSQLFTFSLPGVPWFITGLIMMPIAATVMVVSYAVIRSVFPF